jgi:hypothetical protein
VRSGRAAALVGSDNVGVLEQEGQDVVLLDVSASCMATTSGGGERRGRGAEPEEQAYVAVSHRGEVVASADAVRRFAVAGLGRRNSPARLHFAVGVVGGGRIRGAKFALVEAVKLQVPPSWHASGRLFSARSCCYGKTGSCEQLSRRYRKRREGLHDSFLR